MFCLFSEPQQAGFPDVLKPWVAEATDYSVFSNTVASQIQINISPEMNINKS